MDELRGRFEATELRLAELESRVAQLEYQLVVRGPEDVNPRRSRVSEEDDMEEAEGLEPFGNTNKQGSGKC